MAEDEVDFSGDRGRTPIEELVQDEMVRHLTSSASRAWKFLDVSQRWKLVLSFLEETHVLDGVDIRKKERIMQHLRDLVKKKDAQGIHYDKASQRVTSMTCLDSIA